jgi:hypothetical protein
MLPRVAQFLDVCLGAVVYPIACAGIAADHVEVPEALLACSLLGREPFCQQGQRSLGFVGAGSRWRLSR